MASSETDTPEATAPDPDPDRTNTTENTIDTTNDYAHVIFTADSPPNATGSIAKHFAAVPTTDQRSQTEAFFSFLTSNENPMKLNGGNNLFTALLIVPDTSNVRVIYGTGYCAGSVGASSPIDNKFLALSGEGDATVGPPEVQFFPTTVRGRHRVLNPPDDVVQAALTSRGARYGKHLIVPRSVAPTNTAEIMLIAPIPPYLIYDGFNTVLDAAMVYERLLLCLEPSPWLTHARAFVRSALVGQF